MDPRTDTTALAYPETPRQTLQAAAYTGLLSCRHMSRQPYRAESWNDPGLVLRTSPLNGRGVFATDHIRAGEVVIVWGGRMFTASDIEQGLAKRNSLAEVGDGIYLGAGEDDPESIDDYMNHSCDPSCWMLDEVTIATRRDIQPNQELTLDYAMFSSGTGWRIDECRCASQLCRNTITGSDWKIPDLHVRYRDHFSPYLNARISAL